MTHRLKKGQEAFQVVDGPFAKRHYRPGVDYKQEDIPPQEKQKFEKITTKARKVESTKEKPLTTD